MQTSDTSSRQLEIIAVIILSLASPLTAWSGYQAALAAAENAGQYVRNTLFLASALFFIGVSRMFSTFRVRLVLEVMAAILLLVGIYNLLAAPIA